MNAARISKSPRLQRVARLLSSGGEHTTLDIASKAQVCAVSAAVAELRDQGFTISCQRRGDLWYYRMATDKAALSKAVGL